MSQALTATFALQLRTKLDGYQFSFSQEAGLQEQLEAFFRAENYDYQREVALGPRERPDFLLPVEGAGLAAIEVKRQGGVNSHLRQMKRYAGHQRVCCVILICIRPVDVPATLGGKPAYRISLWKQLRFA